MADYWKSNPRYFCRYCGVWMADDKPSRTLHDNGNKHKANVQKFLSNLEKKDREEKFEKEQVLRTLQEVEKKAMKQYAKDVGDPSDARSSQYGYGGGKPFAKTGEKRTRDEGEGEEGDEDDEHPDFDPEFDYNALWTGGQAAAAQQQQIPEKAPETVQSNDAYGDWTVVETSAPEPPAPPTALTVAAPKAAPSSSTDWFEKKNTRHVKPENTMAGEEKAFATSIHVGDVEERDPDDLRNFAVKERTIDTFDDDLDAPLPTIRVHGAPTGRAGGWSTLEDAKVELKEEVKKEETKVKVEDEEGGGAAEGGSTDGAPSLFKKRKVAAGGNIRKK